MSSEIVLLKEFKKDKPPLKWCVYYEHESGDVVTVTNKEKDFINITCNDGFIKIKNLTMEGKKRMNAKDFIRGYKIYNEIKNERIYKKLS